VSVPKATEFGCIVTFKEGVSVVFAFNPRATLPETSPVNVKVLSATKELA
jgi:hypothetical protein